MGRKVHPIINMKIRNKMLSINIILTLISVIIVIVSLITINRQVELGQALQDYTIKPSEYLSNMAIEFNKIFVNTCMAANSVTFDQFESNIEGNVEPKKIMMQNFELYKKTLVGHTETAPEKTAILNSILDTYDLVDKAIVEMSECVALYDVVGSINIYNEIVKPDLEFILNSINQLVKLSSTDAERDNAGMVESRTRAYVIMFVTLGVSIILSAIMMFLVQHVLVRPINLVSERASRVASGYFKTSVLLYGGDEIGQLSRSVDNVSKTYAMLIKELSIMAQEHEKGDMDYRIDPNRFDASYREVIVVMNSMVDSYISSTIEILKCVDGICKGNFDAELKKYPGKKAFANEIVDDLRTELRRTNSSINALVDGVRQGNLSNRADLTQYNGDWKAIYVAINGMMEAISAPIEEAVSVLGEFSNGKLDVKVKGDYKGSFGMIKTSLNESLTKISSYIVELTTVLGELTNDNLNISIQREYVGEFVQMKDSINAIVDKFNGVLKELYSTTEQVGAGAKQISQSSALLAEGALNQTNSIQMLNEAVNSIKEKTITNADNAKLADKLSQASKENATLGNVEMKQMLISMDGIKESSNNIFKIIKVIEDIAFQTNLLALNAAVEAARAGSHGKGFAVVAEEVRNLAARSQSAAKETTELIEDSIHKVSEGTKIAGATADALSRMIVDATKVSDIVSQISDATIEQSNSIVNISRNIDEISSVVQSNSATSEQSAAAAQELSSRSEALQHMVSVFRLKS